MALQTPHKGILPCCNCLVVVPQDKVVSVESFGSFLKVLEPGLSFAGLDICGACINLNAISTRVDQIICRVPTKTRDNVFVQAEVAVQLSVMPDRIQDAVYKLTNVQEQLESYAAEVVRSLLPTLTLDEAFEKKEEISGSIKETLGGHMQEYGWQIHNALVTDLKVNPDVMRSMNEINRQKRLRDASVMAAEADKIRTVKQAEGEADAAQLAGEGIARQRGAIITGLRQAIGEAQGETITTEDITTLLLTTQYFETLKDIGSRPTSKTYFLPKGEPNDPEYQTQSGLLQGTVGLEHMMNGARGGGGGGYRGPAQQSMGAPSLPRSSPSPAGRSQYLPPSLPEPSYSPPPSRPQQRPPPQQQRVTLQVQVPPGARPGQVLQIQAPDGRVAQVQIPPGTQPGQVLQVQF
mmetsp:Transcript_31178/g.87665  ORF Transcript_31178/g.87665 Transcript_31178/m.87665 type:complete len:407 (-) Transcript_31178:102-1322(-)